MKIIHTADIHLDSPMTGVADGNLRRRELLRALFDMAEFANNNGVEAIVVAGDLFDTGYATQMTVESVAEIINNCKARWFVLKGNHGGQNPYELLKKLCPKVQFFGDDWTIFKLGKVNIIGRELPANDPSAWDNFSVPEGEYNILVLHGDVDDGAYGVVDKKAIAASNINYVALGHRHTFCQHKFGRVKGCYCGVLEPRGFDEADTSGFVVVDTENDKILFKQQYIRRIETVTVDISQTTTDFVLEKQVLDSVSGVSAKNYLNLVFVGNTNGSVHPEAVAKNVLEGRFFALRISDKTTLFEDWEELKKEVSLRGEFVKLAMEIADETERNEVLKLGLAALRGEL